MTLRLFLGLWPDDAERLATVEVQRQVAWPATAKLVRPENLHITLHFLGSVEEERIPALEAAVAVEAAAVQVRLESLSVWHGGIAVLEPIDIEQPLAGLHRTLQTRLDAAGFATEQRRYRPHVTLARKAVGASAERPIRPTTWRTKQFALVQSAGGRYAPLRFYPLQGS
jgi:2'-5' RNA ligase